MQNDTLCLTSKFSFYLDIDLFINSPTFLSITYFSVICGTFIEISRYHYISYVIKGDFEQSFGIREIYFLTRHT